MDTRGPCPCGRTTGLTLASIEGRVKDVTFAADGRAITVDELDAALARIQSLEGWQLDLPEPLLLHLRLLTDPASAEVARRAAREILEQLYGAGARVEVTAVPSLQPELSGKFRFARTAFPVDHSQLWKEQPRQVRRQPP